MAAPLLWLVGAVFAGGAVLLARGADHEQGAGSPGGAPTGPYVPPTGGGGAPTELSCADALNVVGATPGAASLAATISLALAKSTDPAALDALALQLETAAGSSSTTPDQRAALIRLAQCCRDRATALRVAKSLETGSGASLSSASPGYAAPAPAPAPTYTAAPAPELAAPLPPPQPTAVVVDSYSAARSSPMFTAARMGGFY